MPLVAIALAACAAQPSSPAARPTIVSLNPCTDAILAKVTVPGQLLAISNYSEQPGASSMDLATARRFRATGGSAEEVLALKPDLVVAGSFLAPATRRTFSRLGMRVVTFGVPDSVAQSEAQVRQLAGLVGHPGKGTALVGRIEAALAAAKPPDGWRPPDALVWQEGGIVAGGDSLVAELLGRSGFANHAAARGLGQGAYLPLERVLANPPRLIIAAGGERALTHPALKTLKGTEYARIARTDLYCGGPTIIRLAKRLAEIRRSLGPRASTGSARAGVGREEQSPLILSLSKDAHGAPE